MTTTPTISQSALEKASTRCKVSPHRKGMHDFQRTEEMRLIPHAPGETPDFEQRVWVCSKCGQRVWWW